MFRLCRWNSSNSEQQRGDDEHVETMDDKLGELSLKLSYDKIDYIVINKGEADGEVEVNRIQIKKVDSFKYLRSMISADGMMIHDINKEKIISIHVKDHVAGG